MPSYYSTRDPTKTKVSFKDALLFGLAPDGGLYIPGEIPALDPSWREAASLSELGTLVLTRWLGAELAHEEIAAIAEEALNFEVPLVTLADDLGVLELTGGPTLSFKDVGARTMARLMNAFLRGEDRKLTILVATSGDTGSAVADGFAGQENVNVVLLYPKGKVSAVQELQLIAPRKGVRTFAVAGDFDACQRLVKEAFVDPELRDFGLSSANSINLGRLLPQSTYYLWGAVQAQQQGWDEVVYCVPSGNLGNLMAGMIGTQMAGLKPQFIAAHNANDFFPGFLEARYQQGDVRNTIATLSNAMDVGAPSNFERLYALLGGDALREGDVWATSVSDEVTRARMKQVYEAYGYIACPHTAVGFEGAARYREATGDARPVVVLATAHPAKFGDAVEETLGVALAKVEALERLKDHPVEVEGLEPTLQALKSKLLT